MTDNGVTTFVGNVIGCDPGGSAGSIAIEFANGDVQVAEWVRTTPLDMLAFVSEASPKPDSGIASRCIIERVSSMPKQGVASGFAFGRNYGYCEMIMIACGIPYKLVTPNKWQGKMKCRTKGDKTVTLEMAQRMFPRPVSSSAEAAADNAHESRCVVNDARRQALLPRALILILNPRNELVMFIVMGPANPNQKIKPRVPSRAIRPALQAWHAGSFYATERTWQMANHKPFWFKFNVEKWISGTHHMTNEVKGCYLSLLIWQFEHDHIPESRLECMEICGISDVGKWDQIWSRLTVKFVPNDDGLKFNEHMAEAREDAWKGYYRSEKGWIASKEKRAKLKQERKQERKHELKLELASSSSISKRSDANTASKGRPKDLAEVQAYAQDADLKTFNAEVYWDWGEANGWKTNGRAIKDWKASARNANRKEWTMTIKDKSNQPYELDF